MLLFASIPTHSSRCETEGLLHPPPLRYFFAMNLPESESWISGGDDFFCTQSPTQTLNNYQQSHAVMRRNVYYAEFYKCSIN